MAFNVGTISANVTADQSDFNSAMKDVHKRGMRVSQKLGDAFMGIGRKLTMGLTVPIGLAGGAMIKMASDAEETEAKFNTVFSNISKDAQKSADVLTKSFGLSQKASKELLGDTGDLLTGFGFTQKSALDLSEDVNKLAVDLASFTNFSGGAEGASKALTKALLGERESVKSLGISILEADVNAKILENTQKGLTFETERQAKAFATLQLAQEQSKNAIGDFARTQDSFANQMRQLKAEVSDLAVEFGKELLPIAKQAVGVARDLIADFSALSDESKKLGLKIAGIAALAGPTLMFLGSMAKAVNSLIIIVPKLVTGMKALTATMMANPYVAVGAAIATIATQAVLAHRATKKLNREIQNALEMDLRKSKLSELNETIVSIQQEIKKIKSEALSQGSLGLTSPKQQEELKTLNTQLDVLIQRRDDLAKSQTWNIGRAGEESAKTAPEIWKLNTGMKDLSETTKKVAEGFTDFNEQLPMLQQNISTIPGSLGALREQLAALRRGQEGAMSPEVYQEIQVLIDQVNAKIKAITGSTENQIKTAEQGGQAMMGLANSIGNMFSQAVLHGSKLQDVVKNLLKQLASKAFVIGIGALLTGGASLGKKTFFETLFGGFRAKGGPVSSGMSYVVGEQGPEIFTPSRSGSIIPNSGSVNGGGGLTASQIEVAFSKALSKHVRGVSDRKIFEMAENGRFS